MGPLAQLAYADPQASFTLVPPVCAWPISPQNSPIHIEPLFAQQISASFSHHNIIYFGSDSSVPDLSYICQGGCPLKMQNRDLEVER